ncbi:MAG: pyridoxamine 5'-phosphate oxidase family protein [Candidatus Aminicenantes bacterium]|nr:pyridoxamine 5'-phosphate oxidase family protein [Candidatus Aminicenantes bacterium]
MPDIKQKIVQTIKNSQPALLATITPQGKPWVRYVTLRDKEDFPLAFCTDLRSRKVRDIQANPEVHITCGNLKPPDDSVYLQIEGQASVSQDPEIKASYWNEEWLRYFKGKDDPNYVIVEVAPYRIEYYGSGSFKPEIWKNK